MSSSSTKLRWALAASLGLNLFFAGYLVARPSDVGRDGFSSEARKSHMTLRRVFRQKKEELVPLRKAVRTAHRDARAELEREPFDSQALGEALGSLRAARTALAEHMHAIVVDVAPELPPDHRKVLLGPSPGARRRR